MICLRMVRYMAVIEKFIFWVFALVCGSVIYTINIILIIGEFCLGWALHPTTEVIDHTERWIDGK